MVDKDGPTETIPKVGMSFDLEKNAYDMYNTYAGKVGFSIRKSYTRRRADKTIYLKQIVCSNQGYGENSTTRTDCKLCVQLATLCECLVMVN